jgi:hypothetical protein
MAPSYASALSNASRLSLTEALGNVDLSLSANVHPATVALRESFSNLSTQALAFSTAASTNIGEQTVAQGAAAIFGRPSGMRIKLDLASVKGYLKAVPGTVIISYKTATVTPKSRAAGVSAGVLLPGLEADYEPLTFTQ